MPAASFGGSRRRSAVSRRGPSSYNGSYMETLTGDYAVSDDLPPSDQPVFWQTFTQIMLNGNPFFTANEIVGRKPGPNLASHP